jgi:hypothetical protein
MFAKLTVAALIPLLLLATTTCGIGCELRCSLGEFSGGGAKVIGGEHSARLPEMGRDDLAKASGHCHPANRAEQPQAMAQTRFKHLTASSLVPGAACSHPSTLVSQLNKAQIQNLAAERRPARLPSKPIYQMPIELEKSNFVSSPPQLTTLRI